MSTETLSGPYVIQNLAGDWLVSIASDHVLWTHCEGDAARFSRSDAEGLVRVNLPNVLNCPPSEFMINPATFATVTHLRIDPPAFGKGTGKVGYLRDGDRPEDTVWFHLISPRGTDPVIWADEIRKDYRVGKRLTEYDV